MKHVERQKLAQTLAALGRMTPAQLRDEQTMNIVVIDTRLAQGIVNRKASSYHLIRVDATMPVPDMMRQVKSVVDYPQKKIGRLTIALTGTRNGPATARRTTALGCSCARKTST